MQSQLDKMQLSQSEWWLRYPEPGKVCKGSQIALALARMDLPGKGLDRNSNAMTRDRYLQIVR